MRVFRTDIPEIKQTPLFMKILDDIDMGHPVYLWGSKGTGKTDMGAIASYAFEGRLFNDGDDVPYREIKCTDTTPESLLIGGQTIQGYKEGEFIKSWIDGKKVILDEMPKLDPNAAGALNSGLAKMSRPNEILYNNNGEYFKKHPDFGCIATGNVKPYSTNLSYVGNNQQDASLWDRFAISNYQIHFNKELEASLIHPILVEQCWKIREKVMEYDQNEGINNDDHLITLRPMLGLQRSYEREMKRELGMVDDGVTHRKVDNGKTLEDAFECFFSIMPEEKALRIKKQTKMQSFYNSYKEGDKKKEFKQEYNRRKH